MKRNILITLLFLVFSIVVVPITSFAQTNGGDSSSILNIWQGTGNGTPQGSCNQQGVHCTLCDAVIVAANITKFLLAIAVALAVIVILYGGIRLMLSAGSGNQVSNAWDIIRTALIGLALVAAAWLIVDTIYTVLAKNKDWSVVQFLGCKNVEVSNATGAIQLKGDSIPLTLAENSADEGNSEDPNPGKCPVFVQTNNQIIQEAIAANPGSGQDLVDWASNYLGKMTYTNDGEKRWDIGKGYSDCSSFVSKAYHCILGTNIGGSTAEIMTKKLSSDLQRYKTEDMSDDEIIDVLAPGDLLGFDVNCRNKWYSSTGRQDVSPSTSCTSSSQSKPFCMGHIMMLEGLGQGNVPVVIHQTSRKPGKGAYSERIKEDYLDPWRMCGYIIHIK